MNILDISILIFIILETLNVIVLYFFPTSKLGNGVAVFNYYSKSKDNEDAHLFVKYMTNWVAGVKLIFIVLLIVILLLGDNTLKLWSSFVVILSITSYFFRLQPLITKLDNHNQITPKGYSKTLLMMITGFIIMFSISIIIYLI